MGFVDSKTGVVYIDPHNTKGKVITIAGLKIGLPKQPPKEEILYHDLPKDQQYWKREEMPLELQKVQEFEGDEKDKRSPQEYYDDMPHTFHETWTPYIQEQYRKRKDGVWFYNKGKPIYITGEHWFKLQWVEAKFGYMQWLEPQWELELHWMACVVDPRCYGQNFVKNRRFGWTTGATGGLLEYITRTKNTDVVISSKSEKDAKEVIFQETFMYMFNKLPFFFTPLRRGTQDPKEILELKAPTSKITKNQKRKSSTGLNSRVVTLLPKNQSGDGMRTGYMVMDESGKLENPHNILTSWQIKKRCLESRNLIIGKCRMGSTVNPMDKGGANYKNLFFDGLLEGDNAKGRNKNGKTNSGMYSIFIPAYRAIIYDKHGYSVVEDPESPIETIDGVTTDIGGKTHLERERESKKDDPVAYNEEIRQMPFNIREAFMDTIAESAFNLQNIEEQLAYVEAMKVKKNNFIVKGRFEWTDGFLSDVKFVPDSQSPKFYSAWLQDPDLRNKRVIRGGEIAPANGWMGVGGLDPFAVDYTVEGGSKGAIYFYNKDNPKAPQECFVLEYIYRPSTRKEFFEDALKAAIFYGYPILIENSKYDIADTFKAWGCGGYLLSRPRMSVNPYSKPSPAEMRKKGLPATGHIIEQLDSFTEEYINEFVGYNDETGDIGTCYFERLLEDWKRYNPHNREKYDPTVAASHALYAAKMDIKKKERDSDKKVKFLRKYSL